MLSTQSELHAGEYNESWYILLLLGIIDFTETTGDGVW